MPLRRNDESPVSSQDAPVQGSRAGATVQLGIDYFDYARTRMSAVEFKEELVKRLLPTVPRRGAPRSIKPNHPFGKFDIVGKLGKGGMAQVFHALDPERGQDGGRGTLEERQSVALKVMKPEIANNPEYVRRFLREAANTALIDHPNVVTVHEVGSVEGRLYFTMELIEGVTLKDHLKHHVVSEAQGVQILCQLVDGLVAAHERGIGHRDLKPSNLMLVTSDHRYGFGIQGEFDVVVKVTDFGLAQMLEADKSDIMQGGRFLGTAKYVAPEVVKGEQSTLKSDVFSLGIMAFGLFAGRPPFKARNKVEYISANLQQQAPLLHTKCDVSRELSLLVDAMLTKDPKQRPEAQAVRRDLGRLAARQRVGEPIVVRDDVESTFARKSERSPQQTGGLPVPILAGGAVALVLAAFVVMAIASSGDPPEPDPDPPVVVDPPDDPVDPPDDPEDPPIQIPDDPPEDDAGVLARIPPKALNFSDQLARLQFDKRLKQGDDAWKQERWRGALDGWRAADELVSPRPLQLARRLRAAHLEVAKVEGQAAEEAGDHNRALELYRDARDAGVDDPDLLARLARAEERLEEVREFNLQLLRLQSLAKLPRRKEQALALGRELLPSAERLKRAAEVQELLRQIESGELIPQSGDTALRDAEDLLAKRDYEGTERALRAAEKRWGESRRLRILRGRLDRAREAPEGFVIVESPNAGLGELPQALYSSDGPVTNGDYFEWFERASKTETLIPPPSWKQGRPPAGSEKDPALGVQESHAKKYARALGGRLPTEDDTRLLEEALGAPIEKPRARGFPDGFRIVRDLP